MLSELQNELEPFQLILDIAPFTVDTLSKILTEYYQKVMKKVPIGVRLQIPPELYPYHLHHQILTYLNKKSNQLWIQKQKRNN